MKCLYKHILISLLLYPIVSDAFESPSNIAQVLEGNKVEHPITTYDFVGKTQERIEVEFNPKNAERIVNESIKQIDEAQLQVAKNLTQEVKLNQKQLLLQNLGNETTAGKLANKTGVNISQLLSRYNSKVFLNHENDKLPGLMVFISFSMPQNSLKQLVDQLRQAGGVLVLRGMYGSLQKTINAIYELNKQGVPAIIHPELFKKYDIKVVPTFILEDKERGSCKFDNCTRVYDKLTGNVSLGYVLRECASGGSNSKAAQRYLKRIEEVKR